MRTVRVTDTRFLFVVCGKRRNICDAYAVL